MKKYLCVAILLFFWATPCVLQASTQAEGCSEPENPPLPEPTIDIAGIQRDLRTCLQGIETLQLTVKKIQRQARKRIVWNYLYHHLGNFWFNGKIGSFPIPTHLVPLDAHEVLLTTTTTTSGSPGTRKEVISAEVWTQSNKGKRHIQRLISWSNQSDQVLSDSNNFWLPIKNTDRILRVQSPSVRGGANDIGIEIIGFR